MSVQVLTAVFRALPLSYPGPNAGSGNRTRDLALNRRVGFQGKSTLKPSSSSGVRVILAVGYPTTVDAQSSAFAIPPLPPKLREAGFEPAKLCTLGWSEHAATEHGAISGQPSACAPARWGREQAEGLAVERHGPDDNRLNVAHDHVAVEIPDPTIVALRQRGPEVDVTRLGTEIQLRYIELLAPAGKADMEQRCGRSCHRDVPFS